MCVDTGVSGSASQVLVLPVRDVLMCSRISVLFGKAKVYDVDEVTLCPAHQEVVQLHISIILPTGELFSD